MNKSIKVLLLAFATLVAQPAVASDVEELTDLLHEFLANSDKEAAHERFWADDLVYSSSAGLRFGKADIMSGFDSASEEESSAPPPIGYSGEEVDVRLYGDMAVVAFKLVGTPTDEGSGAGVMYYYNTGTFWKAVAWQATKIPPE
jgi:hypothetical protein